MTTKYLKKTWFILTALFIMNGIPQVIKAQNQDVDVILLGTVIEAGTDLALGQVTVSVASSGLNSTTDEQGAFTLTVPNLEAEIIVNLPGYNVRNIYLHGRNTIQITLVPEEYTSIDNLHNTPLGATVNKNSVYSESHLSANDLDMGNTSSVDQLLQGKIAGLSVTEQSGMPGHRTFLNIRGHSSLYAQTEPLLFIDGMIHDYAYATNSLMEGFSLNPFDLVDYEDISDISILKDGNSYLGSLSSNGAININTEQRAEASTVIKFSASGGISFMPKVLPVLNADQFSAYFNDALVTQGYDDTQINTMYPWLNGDESSADYYKYNNSTDWQDEIFNPASLTKLYFFIKGGDDIATYNISTGYMAQEGIYDNSRYTRFNLRINGKVNISNKFAVTPNVKLSLAESDLANQGLNVWKNPMISSVLKSPLMSPIARDEITGEDLTFIDDVGVFGVSNPRAIVNNALGNNRNYHILSSLRADYKINNHFNLHTIIGINFNNARESIFLPDLGIVQVDSAYNSPGDFVNEYRSTQSHTALTYTNKSEKGNNLIVNAGFRFMENSTKFNKSVDLNTPSDDFKNLWDGSQYSFLRYTIGDNREMVWLSYYGDIKYNFRDKYFVNSTFSMDASSVTNDKNRYNVFPSVGLAWRISSEEFMSNSTWIDDFKARASYSVTGNLFSTVYDYSKLYYTDRRMNGNGVLVRESIPNEDLELEKKNTINAGLDLSVFGQSLNFHADYFIASVNNLIVQQQLPVSFGYDTYYDNGGVLSLNGFEVAADYRKIAGNLIWTIGGTVSQTSSSITKLKFLKTGTEEIISTVNGAQFITSKGHAMNEFYGYETNGLISAGEAGTIIGPRGIPMQEGDIKYVDSNTDGTIDEADKTFIGNPNPDLCGGFFTAIGIKNFTLSADFNFSVGNDAFNYVKYKTESMDSYYNQSTNVLDRYTASNTTADLPRFSYGDPTGNTVFSERWIEDASYLRLRKLTLSYKLQSNAVFKGATIYITATNLLTLTKYSGFDPEFSYMNSPFYMGIDYGMMPQTKSVIAGIKLDL
jgi:TonB-linked SusC/RagA family outer membrane protein